MCGVANRSIATGTRLCCPGGSGFGARVGTGAGAAEALRGARGAMGAAVAGGAGSGNSDMSPAAWLRRRRVGVPGSERITGSPGHIQAGQRRTFKVSMVAGEGWCAWM